MFLECFAKGVWEPRYRSLIKVDGSHHVAGFNAPRLALSYIDYDRKLSKLGTEGDAGWEGHTRESDTFYPFVQQLAKLSEAQQATAKKQAHFFLATALKVLRRHSQRWLRDLLYTSLAGDEALAIPLGKVLLAARAAKPPAAISSGPLEGWTYRAPTRAEIAERPRYELADFLFFAPNGECFDDEEAAKAAARTREYKDTRAQRAMEAAITAEIDAMAIENIIVKDSRTPDDDGRSYPLKPLLTELTAHLDAAVVARWPIPVAAVTEWVGASGALACSCPPCGDSEEAVEAAARHDAPRCPSCTCARFRTSWCIGMPSNTQSTEREHKLIGEFLRRKPQQQDAVTATLHQGEPSA